MQKICTKYAGICNICNHEFYMQDMQEYALPTLLMQAGPGRRQGPPAAAAEPQAEPSAAD
jgi:hypothetical protein